jgi:hypothetical protein
MTAKIIDLANARTQRAAAAAAARAASDALELVALHALKQMLDKMIQDKERGIKRSVAQYLAMVQDFCIEQRRTKS